MSISTAILTAEQARVVRDNEPTLSDRPQGVDLPLLLNTFAAEVSAQDDLIASGVGTILNGATTVVIAVGAQFDGEYAIVGFAEAPVAAVLTWAGVVAGGNLTINVNADNTADVDVSYIIDGRA